MEKKLNHAAPTHRPYISHYNQILTGGGIFFPKGLYRRHPELMEKGSRAANDWISSLTASSTASSPYSVSLEFIQ